MTTILFNDNHSSFENRINFVLKFLEQHPLVRGKILFTTDANSIFNLKLNYGLEQSDSFFIPSQKLFFSPVIPHFESLTTNQYLCGNRKIYSVESISKEQIAFNEGKNFQFDIFETIFFHISRFEEWHYSEGRMDEHGRMDEKKQFLVKNRIHRSPVIDELIRCFLDVVLGVEVDDQKTKLRITHDIDFIAKRNDFWGVLKSMGGAILKRQDFQSAIKVWQNRFDKNPYDTFDWMLRKEENIEKVIYFLVGGLSKFDNTYDLNLPVFRKTIQLCKERGYKIGIHPSYNSLNNSDLMKEEKEKLQDSIGGKVSLTRQHYLRFSFKDTPQIIQQLGFKEDSSIGYADRIGFRCGTGFSYHLYNFDKEKAFDFLETPLVFMDSALFTEANHQPKIVQKIWEAFISENRFNTQITFNFHNSRFYDASLDKIPLRVLYEDLFSTEND